MMKWNTFVVWYLRRDQFLTSLAFDDEDEGTFLSVFNFLFFLAFLWQYNIGILGKIFAIDDSSISIYKNIEVPCEGIEGSGDFIYFELYFKNQIKCNQPQNPL